METTEPDRSAGGGASSGVTPIGAAAELGGMGGPAPGGPVHASYVRQPKKSAASANKGTRNPGLLIRPPSPPFAPHWKGPSRRQRRTRPGSRAGGPSPLRNNRNG